MNTTSPTDYLAALEERFMNPDNGTVSYWLAWACAELIGLTDQFSAEYSHMEGERIDLGEYNVWVMNLL